MLQRVSKIILLSASLLWLASCTSAPRYRSHTLKTLPADTPEREKIVQIANSFIGTPYRSGGTTPKGVDCSGLVTAVYRSVGVKLPRRSNDQARTGVAVGLNQMRPGDLVFFTTSRSRSVSHVGIYIGKNQFIHASTRARRVRVDNLELPYFRDRFVVARRVL